MLGFKKQPHHRSFDIVTFAWLSIVGATIFALPVWQSRPDLPPAHKWAVGLLVICLAVYCSSRTWEAFQDVNPSPGKSADEAGLVFGVPPTATSRSGLTLYSGTTLSLLGDSKRFLGRVSQTSNSAGLCNASQTDSILSNLRVQLPNQVDFGKLQPLFYQQNVSLLHVKDGADKAICVDKGSGQLLCDGDPNQNASCQFKLVNPVDELGGDLLAYQAKVVLKYVGDGGTAFSYVVADKNGKLTATGSFAGALPFTIQACMGGKCAGPNWRFQ